ncbi:MAG: hypothetical protein SOX94_02990 [Prevotella sp.]|nr:hypothetical protein [Prevotella sp.]MDY4160474.1 hypothetical protein [Prevotella sp.]
MEYFFKASQTIVKQIIIEAANKDSATEIAQKMLENGEIRFDDEPYLPMECIIELVNR